MLETYDFRMVHRRRRWPSWCCRCFCRGGVVGGLAVFATTYGVFAGGFTSTSAGVGKEVVKLNLGAEMGVVFGMLAGPLSEVSLRQWSYRKRPAAPTGASLADWSWPRA